MISFIIRCLHKDFKEILGQIHLNTLSLLSDLRKVLFKRRILYEK